ncbi:MAG: hypothetical protein LBK28_06730 [Propionibacteriaceae bacterium]|jgi:hypothetical protein|nr:hypothetical protein [Propionibacteriaceae bacterium]
MSLTIESRQAVGATRRAGFTRGLRLVVAGLVAVFATLNCQPIAHADDLDAANEAAGYLISKMVDGKYLMSDFGSASTTAEGILALAATQNPEYTPQLQAMTGYLTQQVEDYISGRAEAAAKLVLVAIAADVELTSFGGVDLLERVKAGIAEDGAFGEYPMAYASGLGIVALIRAGQEVDPKLVDWMIGQAEPDGSFSYQKGGPGDPDNTAMAILALSALPDLSPEAAAALEAAKKWAVDNQQPDGSWTGMAAVNSTALLGSALLAAGVDQSKAITYLASSQAASGGLPANLGEELPDTLATTQAILLLSGQSYLTLQPLPAYQPGSATPVPTASSDSPGINPDDDGVLMESQPLPMWVVPVVIVAAVIALAAVVMARRKKH